MRYDLLRRLKDEADQCRNDGADDIAKLLDETTAALDRWEHVRRSAVWSKGNDGLIKWMFWLQMPEPDIGAVNLHEGTVTSALDAGIDAVIRQRRGD